MKGIVKWFNIEKGYGFIGYDDRDIYVHYSSIIDKSPGFKNLIEGETVEFDIVYTDKGLRAKNVRTVMCM